MPYFCFLSTIASSSSQAVMHVEAALSQVYDEARHDAMSLAHWALQLAPSGVVGLKLLPAAQPTRRAEIRKLAMANFKILSFLGCVNNHYS
jgi:hypothetical protein